MPRWSVEGLRVFTVSECNEGPVLSLLLSLSLSLSIAAHVPAHKPFAVPVDVSDAVFFPVVVLIRVPLPNVLFVISKLMPFVLNDLSITYSFLITITKGCTRYFCSI